MKLYKIRDWDKHFEVRDTNRVDGPLKWVPVPTKTDGFGFSRLASEKDAAQLLAAWYLMLGIAAKQERTLRGRLVRDGRPLTDQDLATITRFPKNIFTKALAFFSSAEQGWMICEEVQAVGDQNELGISDAKCASPDQQCASGVPTGQDRTGQDRKLGAADAASTGNFLDSIRSNPAYKGINIEAEFGKMQAWCAANHKQPTNRRFVNWLNRCERPLQSLPKPKPSPDIPVNWRAKLDELYPDNIADTWAALPPSVQAQVRAAI